MAQSNPPAISRFLKEPFVQFLLIGAAIFAASYLFAPADSGEEKRIVIGRPAVQAMAERIRKISGDKISEGEFESRVDQELERKIREEILYREGLGRGLDKDDSVVQARVAALMERMAKEVADSEPFSSGEIEAYYNENQHRFTKPKRISFGQVFFSSATRGRERALADCRAALAKIQAGELTDYAELEKLGDKNPALRGAYRNVTLKRVGNIFGESFVRDLGDAGEPGVIAPVESKYGYHVVQLREVVPSELQPLETVRGQIEKKLEYDRNQKRLDDFYKSAKGSYTIVVEDER